MVRSSSGTDSASVDGNRNISHGAEVPCGYRTTPSAPTVRARDLGPEGASAQLDGSGWSSAVALSAPEGTEVIASDWRYPALSAPEGQRSVARTAYSFSPAFGVSLTTLTLFTLRPSIAVISNRNPSVLIRSSVAGNRPSRPKR